MDIAWDPQRDILRLGKASAGSLATLSFRLHGEAYDSIGKFFRCGTLCLGQLSFNVVPRILPLVCYAFIIQLFNT